MVCSGDSFLARLAGVVDGVGRLHGRNDSLGAGQQVEPLQCLLVGHGQVLGAFAVLEEAVLRADAGIVQSGGDAVGRDHLSVLSWRR